jgi:tetratricopeptide (TPR) repeat protein
MSALPESVQDLLREGMRAHSGGHLDDAMTRYSRALDLDSGCVDALNLLGAVRCQMGDSGRGVALLRRAVEIAPRHHLAWLNLGLALRQQGQHEAAVACFDRVIALRPDAAAAYNGRGAALGEMSRHAQAVADFERAVALAPGYAAAYNNLGNSLRCLDRVDAAIDAYRRCIELDPADAVAFNHLGISLAIRGQPDEALRCYEQATALEPSFALAHANRGAALMQLGRHSEALESYDRALSLDPASSEAYANRGAALMGLERPEDALDSLRAAICAEQSGSASTKLLSDARWNQALAQLSLGRLAQGWVNYEARWSATFASARRHSQRPGWLGEEPVEGLRLLLWSEQGFGDAIQFSRYATLLAQRGAQVWVEVRPALKPLIGTVPGVSGVIGEGEAPPEFDRQCPLMSLPLAFGTTLETIPGGVPYVTADPQRVAAWRQRWEQMERRPTVGVVCSGSGGHKRDASRSIGLERLQPLLGMAECVLLQPQVRAQDEAVLSEGMVLDVRSELTDFGQTAALIETLDLVITVDTAVAHLAGALGKPVWILLSFGPDWRWMLERSDSPWYPTARLYRQPRPGDWAPVVDAVARDLQQLLS